MNKLKTDREAQLKVTQDELVKMQRDMQELEQRNALTDVLRKRRADEMQAKYVELNENARKFEVELQRREFEATRKITQELETVIKAVATADKIDMVFHSPAVVYAPNAVDITKKVIEQYDRQQPR